MRRPRSDAGLSIVAFVILGLPTGALGVAWPQMRLAWHAPLAGLGWLVTIATVVSFSCVATGRLVESVGARRLLILGALVGGLGVIGLALAPSWPVALFAAAVWGLGTGPLDAVMNAQVARSGRVRLMGWIHAAWGLGAAAGPPAALLAIQAGSWRWSFLGMGVTFLALAAAAGIGGWGDGRVGTLRAERPEGEPLTSGMIGLAVMVFAVYVGLEWSTGQWAFTNLTLARGLRPTLAGSLVSLYWISLTAGRALMGLLGSPVPHERLLTVGMSLAVIGTVGLWLAPPILAAACLPLIGLGLSIVVPLLYLSSGARGSQAARLIGYQAAGGTAGAATIPTTIGFSLQSLGAWTLGPALAFLALLQVVLHALSLRQPAADRRATAVKSATPARR